MVDGHAPYTDGIPPMGGTEDALGYSHYADRSAQQAGEKAISPAQETRDILAAWESPNNPDDWELGVPSRTPSEKRKIVQAAFRVWIGPEDKRPKGAKCVDDCIPDHLKVQW